jgi:glycosyltransferase involved in cell wall biosynthesis
MRRRSTVAEHDPRVLMAVQQLRRRVPGGIGNYARGLLDGLTQSAALGEDVPVTLLAARVPGHPLRAIKGADDPLTSFERPVLASRWPGPVMTRLWDRGWWPVPSDFDIVHSVSLAFPPIRRDAAARSVVTVHDVAWRRQPDSTTRRGRKWHETSLLRARDSGASLVVPSKFVAADLVADGVDESRLTIIPGGSDHLVTPDPDATDELLERLGVDGEFLLTVSTLEPRKNVDRLLRAYRMARASLPEPWPLVIVGPTGWGPQVIDPEEQAGVLLAGAVDDAVLTGLYRRARAFAYVPLTEGYGLPPLEAMRMGTPAVVAHEVPSVHDLGQAGEPPARVVDPWNVDDIATGLVDVLTDDDLRVDLAARGQAHALKRTWLAVAQQHRELWRSL